MHRAAASAAMTIFRLGAKPAAAALQLPLRDVPRTIHHVGVGLQSEQQNRLHEPVDAARPQRAGRKPVRVRISPPAPWPLSKVCGRAYTGYALRVCCVAL